jgi:hypothetical protein
MATPRNSAVTTWSAEPWTRITSPLCAEIAASACSRESPAVLPSSRSASTRIGSGELAWPGAE